MTTITHERLRADALRQWQAHYDENIFSKIGMKAPQPVADQSVLGYRQETDRMLKRLCLPQNHEFYQVQWRRLETEALDAMEPQLFEHCKKEFVNPDNIPAGEFRMVQTVNPQNGLKENHFYGKESFVKAMGIPGRRGRIRNPDRDREWFADANRRTPENRSEYAIRQIY